MTVLGVGASLIIVVVSTLVYVTLLWWADRYEKEPKRLFLLSVLWGAIPAVGLSLLGELSLDLPDTTLALRLVETGVAGPIIEETAKGVMVLILLWLAFMEFDGVLDGLIYGALIGFGFAMTENFLYFVSSLEEGIWTWAAVLVLRQFVFGLNHAFYTAFTGIGVGLFRVFRGSFRVAFPFLGWGLAVFFHGLHNATITLAAVNSMAFILTLVFDAGGILIVGAVLIMAILREHRILTRELASEVGNAISAEDYERVRRFRLPLVGLSAQERRRLRRVRQLAAELALKKHQQRLHGETRDVRLRIQQLRAALVALRHDKDPLSISEEESSHAQ